ncbi:tetratricopeptide repeat protein [Saccharicrinis aurantiacus]|uniref:tetratricopeptide repeat protein n=1 Tax=Saccharicrinis aurantiacus TaxID=1849719 RepID=UPI000837DABB|nr:tetratricopeptide repeat protein [Saccharicrinis aurantiacus]
MKNYLSGKLLWLIVLLPITVFSQTQVKRKSTFIAELYDEASDDFNNKNYEEALVKFTKVIDESIPEHSAYFRRGYCYYYLGEYEKAIYDTERAFELVPKDHRYFYLKAQSYDKLKQIDICQYYLNLAIAFKPNKLYYYKYRSALNLELGNYKKAEFDFDVLIGKNPNDWNSYYGRGLSKFNQKNKTDACIDWNYSQKNNKGSQRFFHYKCTGVDLREEKIKFTHNQIPDRPVFKGDLDIDEYLNENIEYSISTFISEQKGSVLAKFVLTKELEVEDIEMVQTTNKKLSAIVEKVIAGTKGQWFEPAKLNGKAVDYTFYLPVIFKLNDTKYRIAELTDSLSVYKSAKDYFKLYETANQILFTNPFMYEAISAKQFAIDKISPGVIEAKLLTPKMRNAEVLSEVWANQKYSLTHYTNKWQVCNKSDRNYYRVCEWEGPQFEKNGFFIDFDSNNKQVASGTYSNDKKDGFFHIFYPNGLVKESYVFSNNLLNDTVRYYYKNGNIQHAIKITNDGFEVLNCKDEEGNNLIHDGNGIWEFAKGDKASLNNFKVVGAYKNHKRDGEWICYLNDDIFLEEEYKNGNFKSCIYYKEGKSSSKGTRYENSQIKSWIFVPNNITQSEQYSLSENYSSDGRVID